MCRAVNRSAAGDVYTILNDGYKLCPWQCKICLVASEAVTVANDMLITAAVYQPPSSTWCKLLCASVSLPLGTNSHSFNSFKIHDGWRKTSVVNNLTK